MMQQNKVLIIDDEKIVRLVLGEFLQILGYDSDQVEDGLAGLKNLENEQYCAVFTDVRMPGMDGIEVTKAVNNKYPGLPVIIVTGHGFDATVDEAMAAGAIACLKKPFAFDQIKEIIEKIAK